MPLTLPSPLARGEEDAVNYFSNGPKRERKMGQVSIAKMTRKVLRTI